MASGSFRLEAGQGAPVQQSATTCGSASLVVARMMTDPTFAQSVLGSEPGAPGSRPERNGGIEPGLFAASERQVMRRTNALHVGRRLNLPWPHALGTSPLGARRELEAITGTAYRIDVVRRRSACELREVHSTMADAVSGGAPVLLYVGSSSLPRHVVLLTADGDDATAARPAGQGRAVSGGAGLLVYDPATGSVTAMEQAAFAGRRLRIAGWDVPWFVLLPRTG